MSKMEAEWVNRSEDTSLVDILLRHIADLVDRPGSKVIFTEKVRALIGIYLGHRPITVAAFASELQMSPRSLQRKLAEEGNSLRLLVRDYLQTLVSLHLKREKGGSMKRLPASRAMQTIPYYGVRVAAETSNQGPSRAFERVLKSKSAHGAREADTGCSEFCAISDAL